MAVVLVASACNPRGTALVFEYKTTTVARLTSDGSAAYEFRSTPGGMVITAPSSTTDPNLRMVGFKKASPAATDQLSCATWTQGATGLTQPGVALRIAATSTRVRAITITNNVLFGARWVFNVHLADSAAKEPMVRIASKWIDWSDEPLPWRICAKAEGRRITVKAWPAGDLSSVPRWDDPAHTTTATVPSAWVYRGRPGWFAGHLAAGEQIVYDDLATATLPTS